MHGSGCYQHLLTDLPRRLEHFEPLKPTPYQWSCRRNCLWGRSFLFSGLFDLFLPFPDVLSSPCPSFLLIVSKCFGRGCWSLKLTSSRAPPPASSFYIVHWLIIIRLRLTVHLKPPWASWRVSYFRPLTARSGRWAPLYLLATVKVICLNHQGLPQSPRFGTACHRRESVALVGFGRWSTQWRRPGASSRGLVSPNGPSVLPFKFIIEFPANGNVPSHRSRVWIAILRTLGWPRRPQKDPVIVPLTAPPCRRGAETQFAA